MLNNDISLKQLPVNIGNLSNLNQLYAISSGLEILPVTIVNLSNLVIVNFSSCKNLYGKVPDLPENVICDYSGTNLCHYQYEEYPNKWAIPADIFCEKVNISPVNMGTSVNNKFAVINNINTVDDNDAEKDIRCGKEFGTSCPAGECCSKYGYCGFSDAHCKIENKCQPEYGLCIDKEGNKIEPDVEEKPATTTTTTAKPVATTTKEESKPTSTTHQSNRCGKGYGACGRGLCCSRYGWCGTTEEFCSVSTCQNEYGVCWAKDPASNKNKNTQGRCGKSYGKCPSGQCCSKYGWCGTSESYCAANKCQSQYGKCSNTTVTNNDTIIRDDGRCGEGFGRCAPGTCCSKYGWCGTEDIFCKVKSGCQPNYGFCKA
ncbi:hypothetical protein BCR36DRAFT_280682 [Piromyces finnis]|uniref:Chitin-binding type-1 domain-containing protein n=1 Tax=Piromyces finnis TaxID=1754191 RepID=A0A1Y1VGK3_9FUNG|nr:hypothetical protein BCR36DRAFT_280682 [Piromyces finnis]|eukprot:ORX55839.1 hypothetical protein BCR36DRAFT_280682 [Piromyces finnis]